MSYSKENLFIANTVCNSFMVTCKHFLFWGFFLKEFVPVSVFIEPKMKQENGEKDTKPPSSRLDIV